MTPQGSIRRRLFFQLAGVAAVLSLTFFIVVRSVAERAAEGTQDEILAASATAIADSLRSENGGVTLDLPYSALSMLGSVSEDRVFYRVTADGKTLTGYDDLPLPTGGRQTGQTIVETWPCYVLFTQSNLANAPNNVVNIAMIFYRSGDF